MKEVIDKNGNIAIKEGKHRCLICGEKTRGRETLCQFHKIEINEVTKKMAEAEWIKQNKLEEEQRCKLYKDTQKKIYEDKYYSKYNDEQKEKYLEREFISNCRHIFRRNIKNEIERNPKDFQKRYYAYHD